MRILGITLMFLSIGQWLLAQDGYPRDRGYDVEHYVFAIDVTQRPLIRIEERLDLMITATDTLVLDLMYDETSKKGMKVRRVFGSNNLDYPYQQKENELSIVLGKSEKSQSIFISYEGTPADGLIIRKNRHGNPTIFGDNWPNRARHWLAVVDHPSEKATSEFIVQVPKGFQCISNGALVNLMYNPDSSAVYFWKSEVPLPSKVMVIGVAEFSIDTIGYLAEKPVTSWVYPEDSETGHKEYAAALPILQFFDSLIGPFPNEKLANVQSTTRYGGMENAGCIFYHEGSTKGDGSIENLIAHEIAHQWFGNSASEADWHHIWLSEGFATYFSYLYDEYKYGKEKLNERLDEAKQKIFKFENANPEAKIIDTSITDLNRLLNPLNYQKGAWVLHMIRTSMGSDSLFFAGIRRYYDTYKLSNAYTQDFLDIMSEVSGLPMSYSKDGWLKYPGHVKMGLIWSKKGNKLMLEHTVTGQSQIGIGSQRLYYTVGDEERYFDFSTDNYTNFSSFPYPEEEPKNFKWYDPRTSLMEVEITKGSSTKGQ